MDVKEITQRAICLHKKFNYYQLVGNGMHFIRQCKKCGQLQRNLTVGAENIWTNLVQLTDEHAKRRFGDNNDKN